jgi:hypothetical protein
VATLCDLVPPGGRLAVGDGAGFPAEAWPAVLQFTQQRPDAHILLGCCFSPPDRIEDMPPGQVSTLVSGFGLRCAIDVGAVGFLPVRLGTAVHLLQTVLRPDLLVAGLRPATDGFRFSTEVSWMRAAVSSGAAVAAIVRTDAPMIDTGEPLPRDRVLVLSESSRQPEDLTSAEPSDAQRLLAEHIARLVPEAARVQVGPGALGAAVYAALERPVAVDTGLLTDPIVDLDRRGLLLGKPLAPYLAGTAQLRDWAPERVTIAGLEYTHHPARLLAGPPLVAVNTCLQIDLDGQANAETVNGSWVGGIGGQPDYAAAAAAGHDGLSIMALTSQIKGCPTLVERLDGPVTTPGHDIDFVVTEHGSADLRGLDRPARRAALVKLWGGDAP